MKKVRMGIIGLGGMGQQHVRFVRELPEAELTAVSDIDEKITKEISKKYKVPGFVDSRELLESGLVDAVLIATPHYFHPPIGISAMERGIHCLSEKPIAVSVKEGDRFVEASRENNVVFGVMHQYRTLPEIRLARKIVESGKLGEIRRTCSVNLWYRSQAYYETASWRGTWSGEGGGVLINQAPHSIDLFLLLGGLPSTVTAKTRTRLHDIEVEDEVSALLEYPNGAWGYYYITVNEPSPYSTFIEISGDSGKLVYQDNSLKFYSFHPSIPEFTFSTKDMWASPQIVEEKLDLPSCETGHKEIIRNFCRAILYGEELIAPGEEGLWTVEFINALILSGKKDKPVDIPVNREEYEELLESLRRSSQEKKVKETKRITDPQHLK